MPLAADVNRDFYSGDIETYPVRAGVKFFKGAAIGEDGSGYARPLVAGDKFKGFCLEPIDNTAGSSGDVVVKTRIRGAYSLPVGSLVIGDNRGTPVYASDDSTFTKTQGSNSLIGYVRRVEKSGVGVVEYDALPNPIVPSNLAHGATFTIGAEAANARTVGVQLKSPSGGNLAAKAALTAYLSSDAGGDALEPASGSLSVAGGAAGDLSELATDNTFLLIAESDGTVDVTITQTSEDTHYLNVVLPDGRVITSAAIAFAG